MTELCNFDHKNVSPHILRAKEKITEKNTVFNLYREYD